MTVEQRTPGRDVVVAAPASTGQSLGDLMELARIMAVSRLLPEALRNKPSDVLVTIMYGQELSMTPMEAILGIYVVNGRPGLSGQKWLERVRKAGHRMYVPCAQCGRPKVEHRDLDHGYVADHDEKHCTVTIERGDTGDEHTETFTWADAERAKLTKKDVWQSWPKRMLLWRATTNCATVICPEVASGFEMAEAMVDETTPERPTLQQVAAQRTDRPVESAPMQAPAEQPEQPEDVDDAEVAEAIAEIAAEHEGQGLLPDDPDLFATDED